MADDSKYPTRIAPYGLRMPPDLKGRVQAAADASGRTLHAELLHTLEESYPRPKADYEAMLELATLLAAEVEKRAASKGSSEPPQEYVDAVSKLVSMGVKFEFAPSVDEDGKISLNLSLPDKDTKSPTTD